MVPGGRTAQKARRDLPSKTASMASIAAPAASRAACSEPSDTQVSASICPACRVDRLVQLGQVRCGACTRASSESAASRTNPLGHASLWTPNDSSDRGQPFRLLRMVGRSPMIEHPGIGEQATRRTLGSQGWRRERRGRSVNDRDRHGASSIVLGGKAGGPPGCTWNLGAGSAER